MDHGVGRQRALFHAQVQTAQLKLPQGAAPVATIHGQVALKAGLSCLAGVACLVAGTTVHDAGEHSESADIYSARGLDTSLVKQMARQLTAHDTLGALVTAGVGASFGTAA